MRNPARSATVAVTCGVLLTGAVGIAVVAKGKAAPPRPAATKEARGTFTASHADFNGDGYADLAVSARMTQVGGHTRAGAVVVTYGGKKGLEAGHRSVVTMATPGVPGAPRTEHYFGTGTAFGDLDADGYTDLAVASRYGMVMVLWGGPEGLGGGTPVTRPGPVRDPRHAGAVPAIGDFDGDRKAELAVVASDYESDDDLLWVYRAGIGRAGPLGAPFTRKVPDWGHSTPRGVSVGDLTGDGIDDLTVVRIYDDSPGGGEDGVLFSGSRSSLGDGRKLMAADAHAIGDVDGDGYGDLVAGNVYRGEVTVVYGGPKGLGKGRAARTFEEGQQGVPGPRVPHRMDMSPSFGAALAVGDVDGDGYVDIAVGSPGGAMRGADPAGNWVYQGGWVTVLRGSAKGATTTGGWYFQQDTKDSASFGYALALTDVDRDGKADLTVRAPTGHGGSSEVWTLRGTSQGPSADGIVRFGPSDLGLPAGETDLGDAITG